MSIKEETYYRVECDHDGCTTDTSDLGDFSAWGDRGVASDEWAECAQRIDIDGETKHYCEKHQLPQCGECDEPGNPDHPDELCDACAKAVEVDQ